MRRPALLLPVATVTSALVAAAAQATPPAALAYAPVPIVLPAASPDPNFAGFRAELAAVAKRRIYAELASLVRPEGFFWDRDFEHRFDPQRPGVDNLAAAVRLEHGNGTGWDLLAAFASEASIEPLPSRPGVVCAPAAPSHDGIAFARLLDATRTDITDWAYPLAAATAVRAAAAPEAAEIGRVGLHFIRLLGFSEPDGQPAPGRRRWARIALPDGNAGYVAPDGLRPLTAERLCYRKDLVGRWQIAGYIAGAP